MIYHIEVKIYLNSQIKSSQALNYLRYNFTLGCKIYPGKVGENDKPQRQLKREGDTYFG